ncbi:MAG: HU family DNA-binding protein [Endomicrobium sp.]|jgi:nucleoid DNA-binding protein|nr:HU family DNA-binding protein [Endomicrobium sp.]
MSKYEIISAIAQKTGSTKTTTETFLNGFIETVKETLKKGGDVSLVGFGTFKVIETKERNGRNPQTGKVIKISAGKRVKFTVGKNLKESV